MRAWRLVLLALAAAAQDPVIAMRGHDQITLSQLRALVASADPQTQEKLRHDPKALQDLASKALLERAVLEEAQAAQWDRRPDVAALLQRTRDAALAQSFLASRSSVPASYPSEPELQAFYDQAKPQLMQPRGYHLVQAFVTLAASGTAADANRAKTQLAALRDALAHADLKHLPATLAQGVPVADLGWVADDRLQPDARSAASGLLEGQVSAPICAKGGCSILRLVATRPAGPAPLADVRAGLIRVMRQAQERKNETAYANALLARSPVRVDEIQISKLAGQ